MRRIVAALAACAVTMTAAPAAHADSFSPPNGTFTFQGPVDVEFGIYLTCDMSVTIQSNAAANDANFTAANLTGGLCGLLSLVSLPWNIDVYAPVPPPIGLAATKLRIKGAKMITAFGSTCGPEDFIGDWNPGPAATITIPVGTELNPPTPGCKISGTLTLTSGPPLTITN